MNVSVAPFLPFGKFAYQPHDAFNSALFINVEVDSSHSGNRQDTLPDLNEADMLGSDLLDALDEDE